MAKRAVIWTETAARQRREILRYWTNRNKSDAYPKKLIRLIRERTEIIANHPEAFIETDYPNTRVSAMGHFGIYYKFDKHSVLVTAFWDNRQDPKRLLEVLKPSK